MAARRRDLRKLSSPAFLAVVNSHANGSRGAPSCVQTVSALRQASAKASSAVSISRNTRVRAAMALGRCWENVASSQSDMTYSDDIAPPAQATGRISNRAMGDEIIFA